MAPIALEAPVTEALRALPRLGFPAAMGLATAVNKKRRTGLRHKAVSMAARTGRFAASALVVIASHKAGAAAGSATRFTLTAASAARALATVTITALGKSKKSGLCGGKRPGLQYTPSEV